MTTDPTTRDPLGGDGPSLFERVLAFAVRRRVLVMLLTLVGAVAGAFALRKLPIDAVPDITNKQVQINTVSPALGPEEMERQVTYPVENALAGIPGLESSRSLTRNGFSQVTAVFGERVDLYWARQQIAERLQAVREDLPPGAEPRMGPIATGLGEVYTFILEYENPRGPFTTGTGEVLETEFEMATHLRTLMEWVVVPQLVRVPGIAGVDVIGGYEKQFHVQPDPRRMVAHGIAFHDLVAALEANNVSTGAGYVESKGSALVVRSDARVRTLEEIGAVAVGSHDGTPIFVRDVADVVLGEESRTGAGSENGSEVVIGTALMLPGGNSRTVAEAVDARMGDIRRSLPDGVRVRTVINRKSLVDSTIRTVTANLAEGALLVVVVLFLMLGNVRAAVLTALAIPLSMLLAAIGMVQAGISGNLMSLGAIDFGIIVDGAVIIVENCLRHLAHEQARLGRMLTLRERLRVVHGAACEVRQATQFGEAIIIMVYLPILALGGVEGKMFHPMALTVIFALAASFVLSLTFIPAGIALFVTGRVTERENPLVRGAKRLYAPVLAWALSWRIPVVAGAVAAFAGSLALFRTLGQEFIPTLDEGNLAYQSLRIPSTSLRQSLAMQFEVEKAIAALPEVDVVFSKTGTTEVAFDPMPPSISDGFIILKPRTQWPDPDLPREKLVAKVGEATSHLPGQLYEASQPIQLRFNELLAGVRGDLAIKVYGDDFDRMRETADAIAQVVREVRGAADVKVEQTEGLPVLSVDVDREASARYGLSAADVQEVLSIAVGGRQAGLVFEGDRRFPLVVRLAGGVRDDLEALGELPVPTPHEERAPPPARLDPLRPSLTRPQFVPLGSIARIEVGEGPNQISRENGKRRVTVTANVRGRDLGGFVGEVRRRVESGVRLPAGSWIDYGGAFQNLLAARSRLAVLVPVCFLVIFLLLHSTFDSTRHAALVFSGVPLGLTGGVLALWARGMPFSISAAVGFIALSGVAVLNGLVMVSRINQLRRDGHALEDAIREGALTRLRPVLMTALVASLGFLPMALSTGSGAEVQRPLATVVIGGIVSSTMLTLVVLPALYRTFHRDGRTG